MLKDFFLDKTGQLSSKRLCGIFGYFAFIVLSPLLTVYLVNKGHYSEATALWTSFGWTNCGLLGVGTFEHFSRKKNEN